MFYAQADHGAGQAIGHAGVWERVADVLLRHVAHVITQASHKRGERGRKQCQCPLLSSPSPKSKVPKSREKHNKL